MTTNQLPNKTARRKMPKRDLQLLASGLCLLEHLNNDEAEALTKAELLNEIDGALLRMELTEEYRAAALDTTARSAEELLGLAEPAAAEAPAEKPKPTNYFDTKPGRHAVLTTACPICEQPAGTRCLGKKGTETIYIHPARMSAWEAAGSPEAPRRTRQAAPAPTLAEATAELAATLIEGSDGRIEKTAKRAARRSSRKAAS